MNKQGNTYTLIYTAVMVIVVAFILAFAAIGLKPAQQKNIAIDKMSQILNSVNIVSTPENAQELYGKYIDDSFVVDANGQLVKGESFSMNIADQLKLPESQRTLPIFICTDDSGSPKYIIPLSGAGLWGPIWGYISIENDGNTVYGAYFAHQSETPGLGAEIEKPQFQKQFPGDSMEQKLSVLNEALPYLAKMRHPAERDMAIRYTADELFLSEQSIKSELNTFRRYGQHRTQRSQVQEDAGQQQPQKQMDFPKNEVLILSAVLISPNDLEKVEACGGKSLFESALADVYADFLSQYQRDKKIDSSRMDVTLSGLFAVASMQHAGVVLEGRSEKAREEILEKAIEEQQYKRLNKRYLALLNRIGTLEKGGQSDNMEQALIELETIRQEKAQFEDKMRGDKQ